MKKVLILQNAADDGPGILRGFLTERGISFHICEMWKDPAFRADLEPELDDYSHLIVLGGHMSAVPSKDEGHRYPYLEEACQLIAEWVSCDRPYLGICLGAQLLARAVGAKVYAGSDQGRLPEVGWFNVVTADQGAQDPLWRAFSGGRELTTVFQWHEDTFELPKGAVRLAQSEQYVNQAFRLGNKVYGVQFHPEVAQTEIEAWLPPLADASDDGAALMNSSLRARILKETPKQVPAYCEAAQRLFAEFILL